MKKRKRTEDAILGDYIWLTDNGFNVVKYSEYHWRAFKGKKGVDIWPTSGKFMPTGGDTSHTYEHVSQAVWFEVETETNWNEDFKDNLQNKLKSLGL